MNLVRNLADMRGAGAALAFGTVNPDEIDLVDFWNAMRGVLPDDSVCAIESVQPEMTKLILANLSEFRYTWTFQHEPSGKMEAGPVECIRHVLIFYRALPKYTPAMLKGKPYQAKQLNDRGGNNYGKARAGYSITTNLGTRYPTSFMKAPADAFTYIRNSYGAKDRAVIRFTSNSARYVR